MPLAYGIHLFDADLGDARWDSHRHVLDEEELARFDRVRRAEAATAQRRCRIALRLLLARRLAMSPAAIKLSYGRYGKPGVEGGAAKFSLSHSSHKAMIAIAETDIGVDLERVDEGIADIENLLDMICHPLERREARETPPEARRAFFFRLWTRKEAYCKATGYGLQKPMNFFEIREYPGGGAVVDPMEPGLERHILDLAVAGGWMAALCSPWRSPVLFRSSAESLFEKFS